MTPGKIVIDEDGRLFCPNCASENLHHVAVKVYFRTKEDGTSFLFEFNHDDLIEDFVDNTKPFVLSVVRSTENPSERRGAVGIVFRCEECDIKSRLDFRQHKGVTFVDWVE